MLDGWLGDHYEYNATGDRLAKDSMGSWPTRYDYQPGTHRLSGIGHPGQRHLDPVLSDAAGNIVQMPKDGQMLSLDYGVNNRPMQVAKNGRVTGVYVYDANGLRAQKTAGTEVRQFVYDRAAHLLGDYASADPSQREYVWLDGTPVAALDTSARGTVVHYMGTDFLGVPRSIVDAQGHLVWSWDYAGEAFGDSRPLGAYSMPLRFPGQYFDAEAGLSNNVKRDYDSSMGRYVQSDPLGMFGGQSSTYAYANSSPLIFADFSGTQAYASPYRTRGASTIICDGNGQIIVFLADTDSCTKDCVAAHEEVHRQDALKSNAAVCFDQPYGMQVKLGDQVTTDKSEVKAYETELDCLRKELAALKDCDQCRQDIEKQIKTVAEQVVNYGYRAEHPTNGW